MYKPTDTAIDAFLESYRPGKDKNIEASVVAENSSTTNNNNNNNNSGGGASSGSNNSNTSDTNSKSV